jgi:autotransporter-associated beta strand protein
MTTGDTTGTSFMRSNRGIVLGPNGGTIDMSSTTVAAKAIYGQGVAGSGTIGLTTGTTAATLTKTGQGEFRWNGPGTQTAGFTKLVLNRGLYRLGSVTGSNFETGLGAVPVTSTPDAVEFTGTAANPAYFASSFNMTSTLAWNVNRGVKFTGEGTFLGSGGVEINILGPISGSGKLIAGSATSPYNTTGAFSSGTVRLSNVNNASTFTGSVAVNNGTLILNQSLNATNFSGTDTIGDGSGTSTGDLNVNGSSVVFTAGSDNTNSSYAGRVIGTGTFTKVGTGTLTLNTVGANSWTNTAGVKINAGSLKYGSAASGLLDTVPVTIDGTSAVAGQSGTLDLTTAGVTGDTIGSLISTSGNTFGQILQGNANLTLGATAATARTYRGSIISTGGTFTKAGGTFTQNLEQGAVNNTLGAVNVNLGRLNFNGINTTGAVTVASTATLGGNGSVTGAVSVQSGGTLAPGTSLGTFGEGALSMVSGSTFQYELNSSGSPSADLLNINGDLSLGDTTFTGLDLATTSLAIPGTKFTVMSYAGNWDNSTFLGIANGGTVTIGANTFNVKYDDTSAGVNTGSLYSKFVTLAVPGAGCAPGDLNCDGHEDAGDYVFWRKNNSTPAGDYNIWRANFGTPPGSGSGSGLGSGAAVPEPSGIALLMVALAAMATRRRGR